MKLFQIEEPEGGPADPSAAGAAIGIDASGVQVEVAFSVGGNAVVLTDREGFEQVLRTPGRSAGKAAWQELFEAARIRAVRALARPVTHAVIAVAAPVDGIAAGRLCEAAEGAGLAVMRLVASTELAGGSNLALAAAMLAEDLAPRPERDT